MGNASKMVSFHKIQYFFNGKNDHDAKILQNVNIHILYIYIYICICMYDASYLLYLWLPTSVHSDHFLWEAYQSEGLGL